MSFTAVQIDATQAFPTKSGTPCAFTKVSGFQAGHPLEHDVPVVNPSFLFDTEQLNSIWAWIAQKDPRPMLLTGLPGTGKTETLRQIGARVNWPVSVFQCSNSTKDWELFGMPGPLVGPNGEQQFGYIRPDFLVALENPGFIVLDEVDKLPEGVMNTLFGLLDKGYHRISYTGEIIKARAKILFTANTNGTGDPEFPGSRIMDPAFMDRIHSILQFHYPSIEEEVKILKGYYPTIEESELLGYAELAHDLRQAKESDFNGTSISRHFTLRRSITMVSAMNWFAKIKVKNPILRAMEETFINGLPNEDRDAVRQMVALKFNIDLNN